MRVGTEKNLELTTGGGKAQGARYLHSRSDKFQSTCRVLAGQEPRYAAAGYLPLTGGTLLLQKKKKKNREIL